MKLSDITPEDQGQDGNTEEFTEAEQIFWCAVGNSLDGTFPAETLFDTDTDTPQSSPQSH